MNHVVIVGYTGSDPQLSYTSGGTAKLSIRLATVSFRKKANSNEYEEVTEWHSIVVWGKRAEGLAKVLCRGRFVAFSGQIRTRSWEDKESPGTKKYKTEIVVGSQHEITLGPDPRKTQARDPGDNQGSAGSGAVPPDAAGDNGDDIPF